MVLFSWPEQREKGAVGGTLNTQQLKKIFREHDINGDGRLDKEELRMAFQKLGATLPWWRAMRSLQHADVDGDGFITEGEMKVFAKYAAQYGYTLT